MSPDKLSQQDQMYYYHGLILHLADEVGRYNIYQQWLTTNWQVDRLKRQAKKLQDEINGIHEVSKCTACSELDTIYHTDECGYCKECGTPEHYKTVFLDKNDNEVEEPA